MRYAGWCLVAALTAATEARPASAQALAERSPLDRDSTREALDFDEADPGIRVGAFRLFPNATFGAFVDSNFLAAPDAKADALLLLQTDVRGRFDGGVLQIEGHGYARRRQFVDTTGQSTTEGGAEIEVSAAMSSDSELRGRLRAQRRFEPRFEIESPNFGSPSLYNDFGAELQYARTFNRLSITGAASARRADLLNAGQNFRDLSSYNVTLGLAYATRGPLSLTATGYGGRDRFDEESAFIASANTVGALAGVRWTRDSILSASFSAGAFERRYASNLGSISGVSLRAEAEWRATRLTTLGLQLTREDQPTRLSGALGKIRTDARFRMEHGYSRSLRLHGETRLILDEYDGLDRGDTTFLATAAASYLYSRSVLVRGEYAYSHRGSIFPGLDFSRHIASLSTVFRL